MRFHRCLLAIVVSTMMTVSMSSEARPSNKWRLQFSGGADSPGAIVIRLLPIGGEPIETRVEIEDGTGENAVAKAVTKAMRAQLDPEIFHVERDDGEDVLIKRKRGAADFDVEIVSNEVKGVRIRPDRE